MQKALIVFYSQAGQTQTAVDTFAKGLSAEFEIDTVRIESREDFSFPWKMTGFFRAFPRCIRSQTPEVAFANIDWARYDLVILGYQVWFLSPSLPVQAFLKSAQAQGLRGKKVMTLVTCRNLWYSASCWVQKKLADLGALPVGQVTVCELSPVWASFVTTPRWMLSGKKDAFSFFPAAGISDEEFAQLEDKGRKLAKAWAVSSGNIAGNAELSSNLNSVALLLMDHIGHRFFRIWGSIFGVVAPREGMGQDLWLVLFRLSLVTLIITVGPLTVLFERLVRNESKWLTRFSGGQVPS